MMEYSENNAKIENRMFGSAKIEVVDDNKSSVFLSPKFKSEYERLIAEKPDVASQQANLNEAIQAVETLVEFFENYGNRPGLKFMSVDFRSLEGRLTPKLNKLHEEAVNKVQLLDAYQYKFPF
ncbi:hypothetical protein MLD52_12690 [Puniceicoccaceae bacterium K14]|nr:hypothetical protein [Puniceicoccaceae bacterium K14]